MGVSRTALRDQLQADFQNEKYRLDLPKLYPLKIGLPIVDLPNLVARFASTAVFTAVFFCSRHPMHQETEKKTLAGEGFSLSRKLRFH